MRPGQTDTDCAARRWRATAGLAERRSGVAGAAALDGHWALAGRAGGVGAPWRLRGWLLGRARGRTARLTRERRPSGLGREGSGQRSHGRGDGFARPLAVLTGKEEQWAKFLWAARSTKKVLGQIPE